MAAKRPYQDEVDRAVRFLDSCKEHHDKLMRIVDGRSDTYHAVVERHSEASQWQSQLYPPFAMHIVDSTLASMVEDRLKYKIRPRPSIADFEDMAALERLHQGAEAHQVLFDWQVRQSKFTRVQRPFLLQNAIAGITFAKTYWTTREERRRRVVAVDEPLLDDSGQQIVHPVLGPMTYPRLQESVQTIPVYDGPTTEVIDVHDMYWAENARTLEDSRYIAHRSRISYEDLERECAPGGMYGPDNGGWTWKQIQGDIGKGREYRDDYGPRWGEKEQTHDKDLLEVMEVYDNFTKEKICLLNRRSLLAYSKTFPFFHEQPPFTACTTQADLFQVVGISQIEKVAALQEMLWNIQNQSLDSLRLSINQIILYRPDLQDADALEWAPGALWPVESPEQVRSLELNPVPAELSYAREALIKGDMQNLASTFPFSSGTESQTVDQKTATGASIVSALAQRIIDVSKQPLNDAWDDIGNQRLVLNNQFIRKPTLITVLGLDNEEEQRIIYPEILAGDFEYESEPIPNAIFQQQEQAKWQAVYQLALESAPVKASLGQPLWNFSAIEEELLKAMGVDNVKRFLTAKPAEQAPPGVGGQAAPGGGEQPVGITGPGAIAPEVSPGAQVDSAPVTNIQRSLALGAGGGPRNV